MRAPQGGVQSLIVDILRAGRDERAIGHVILHIMKQVFDYLWIALAALTGPRARSA